MFDSETELIAVCVKQRIESGLGRPITTSPSKSKAVLPSPTEPQSSTEHQSLPLSSESWAEVERDSECTPTVSQDHAEDCENREEEDLVDAIEDFSDNDIMAAGRSPKHPRTGSEKETLDTGALLDRASASMDTRIDPMMDRLEKKSDERIDAKLGPVMDRLSALENTGSTTRNGPSSASASESGAGNFGGGGGGADDGKRRVRLSLPADACTELVWQNTYGSPTSRHPEPSTTKNSEGHSRPCGRRAKNAAKCGKNLTPPIIRQLRENRRVHLHTEIV